jgi:hypothetical protein
MRWWLALSSLWIAGAAHAAPAPRLPLASGFDLTSLVTRPRFAGLSPSLDDADRWMAADVVRHLAHPTIRPCSGYAARRSRCASPFEVTPIPL